MICEYTGYCLGIVPTCPDWVFCGYGLTLGIVFGYTLPCGHRVVGYSSSSYGIYWRFQNLNSLSDDQDTHLFNLSSTVKCVWKELLSEYLLSVSQPWEGGRIKNGTTQDQKG